MNTFSGMIPEINVPTKENGVHFCTICAQIDLWNEYSQCLGDCKDFKPIFDRVLGSGPIIFRIFKNKSKIKKIFFLAKMILFIGNATQADICMESIENSCKPRRFRRTIMPELIPLRYNFVLDFLLQYFPFVLFCYFAHLKVLSGPAETNLSRSITNKVSF